MAAASVESPTSDSLNKESESCKNSSPMFSPSSDKRYWSALRSRIDTILENRKPNDLSFATQLNVGESDRAKRMKEDSMLLIRGFDSVAHSLSQLSQNLDNALQGARDLARPPTLTEIYHSAIETAKNRDEEPEEAKEEEENRDSDEGKRGLKRKLEEQGDDSQKEETEKGPKEMGKLDKAKNLAISMATKAASLGRELKSIKSDLCFVQERCAILEEENRRLRDGFAKGIRPEEDDLVRLQLEALLSEKSRLANENANLTRENQCLHQLVEYHQITSQDLSASYEHAIRGMCLDFSSPPPAIQEEEEEEEDGNGVIKTPRTRIFGLCTALDECYDDEQQHEVEG
ncbi:Centrosomal protein [Actinidia chinensis var. chinensis]|uniref:Centrosomal protein n=1 Tax=Actinidia chinensis var. chinensis TaxID=1590841 RepID=A0A2R6QU22_ACTCC|nr:Centrosomal protein [Actinidia chinensis var. chinensis]